MSQDMVGKTVTLNTVVSAKVDAVVEAVTAHGWVLRIVPGTVHDITVKDEANPKVVAQYYHGPPLRDPDDPYLSWVGLMVLERAIEQ